MKKKGFTLIELMIVLAVIAILAVVLVPKAGAAKNNAKNAGVLTNVNTVRGYLEAKTGTNFIGGTAADAGAGLTVFKTTMTSVFPNSSTSDSAVIDPLDATKIGYTGTAANDAIIIDNGTTAEATLLGNHGDVIVIYDYAHKSYTIYGADSDGNKVGLATIK